MSRKYPPLQTTLAASGTADETHYALPGADSHYLSATGSGTVQADFYVDGQSSRAYTVSVSADSPARVNLPDVTKISYTETSTTDGATVTVSGR